MSQTCLELTLAGSCLLFERQTLVSRTGLKNCEPISQLSKMQKQRVLVRHIDEVLLAEAAFRLRARRHRFGQRHADACLLAGQDLLAVEAPEQHRQAVEAVGLPVVQPDVAGRSDVVLASRDFRL
jgi:hypothetical protein